MSQWLKGNVSMPYEFYKLGLKYLDGDIIMYQPRNNNNYNNGTYVQCDNKVFKSIKECSDYYNINYLTMSSWLNKQNKMPQKFIDLNLRYLNDNTAIYEPQIKASRKIVICDKKFFSTVKQCSEYYAIKTTTMKSWLRKDCKTPQKYIDLGLRYYNPEVDGDIEQYEQYIETKVN